MNATGTRVTRPASTRESDWHLSQSPAWPLLVGSCHHRRLLLSPKNLDHFQLRAEDGSWQTLNHEESLNLAEEFLLPGLQPIDVAAVDDDLLTVGRTKFGPLVFEHHWQAGDLIVWDNYGLLHTTTPSCLYEGQSRKMLQLMFSGELLTETPWK